MSYEIKPNSAPDLFANVPQTLFLTDGIEDGVVKQNFEKLNKILTQSLQGKRRPPPNLVYSEVYAPEIITIGTTNVVYRVPKLQLLINTNGNPVRIRVEQGNSSGDNTSLIVVRNTSDATAELLYGWERTDLSNNTTTRISNFLAGIVKTGSVSVETLGIFIPLPAAEFEDPVGSGSYVYQFFIEILLGTAVDIRNIRASAYELGG